MSGERGKDEDRVRFIFIYEYIPVVTVSLARRREQAALYPPLLPFSGVFFIPPKIP